MTLKQAGAAVRYRWKLVSATFLLVTGLGCWFQLADPFDLVHLSSVTVRAIPAVAPRSIQIVPPAKQVMVPRIQPHFVAPTSAAEKGVGLAIFQLNSQIARLRSGLADAGLREQAVVDELAATPAPIVRYTAPAPRAAPEGKDLIALRAQVATDRSALARLDTRYTERHPDVIKAKETLSEDEGRLAAYPKTNLAAPSVPVALPPSAAEIAVHQRRAELTGEKNQLIYQMSALQSDLNRAQDALRRVPKVPLQRATPPEDVPLAVEPTIAALPALQAEASPGDQPVPSEMEVQPSPKLSTSRVLQALPLSVVAGLLASVLLLICVEIFDKSVKGPESLRALLPEGTVYLGAVGRMRS